MVEILKSFEQVASRFSPAVLVLPGLAMAMLGLVAWLAGMCLRRLVPGLIGALAGGMIGFFAGGRNPALATVCAGTMAAFGAILPRMFVAVILAALGAAIAFSVLAGTDLVQKPGILFSGQNLDQADRRFTVSESLEVVQVYILDVTDRIKAIAHRLAPVDLAVVAAAGIGLLAVGLLFERLAGALTFSVVGSGLVFTGLTLLLILKGTGPIACMERQGAMYGLLLLGMAAFGTLEQLLLCPGPARRRETAAGRSGSGQQESKRGWRNR